MALKRLDALTRGCAPHPKTFAKRKVKDVGIWYALERLVGHELPPTAGSVTDISR